MAERQTIINYGQRCSFRPPSAPDETRIFKVDLKFLGGFFLHLQQNMKFRNFLLFIKRNVKKLFFIVNELKTAD